MSKHRAPRYVRTKHVLAGVPVAAGAAVVGLGVLTSPAQATSAHDGADTSPATAVAAEAPSGHAVLGGHYAVRPGDTVATIAAVHGQSWQELYQRNVGVIGGNPGLITPGQILTTSGAAQAAPAPALPVAAVTTAVARISNSAGNVRPHVQAAADAVVSSVPGLGTIGGTRVSAADPGGHPSGLALDYMVGVNAALGDAVAQHHIAHWDELGVDYIIWQQRMLSSPTGSWKQMENRGTGTANHMDHVHVNHRAG
ncbi:LysM peptidoglycan-binding domain-containing protein [Modestobacter lapidis]|nr:LysM peptidoglycan-binding domain-containing protein [Modestobacter lapidis]